MVTRITLPRPNVAVIGGSFGTEESDAKARELGAALAGEGLTVVTGAASGLPLQATMAAKMGGAIVINISPLPRPVDFGILADPIFDSRFYAGGGIKARNVVLVESVDAVVAVGGGFGTLNEFTIAHDEGKLVGVLEGSGGTADLIRELVARLGGSEERIIYSRDPAALAAAVRRQIDADARFTLGRLLKH